MRFLPRLVLHRSFTRLDQIPSFQQTLIKDNTNVPYNDRFFLFQNWDVIWERKAGQDASTAYSSTVTITIPERAEYLYLKTGSGNIRIDGLKNVDLLVESTSGDIYITDSDTECTTIRAYRKIEFVNVTSKTGITINGKHYDGGTFTSGNGDDQTTTLKGENKDESIQKAADYNGIDFINLPNMTSKEVDALALSYIDATGQFGYVYNMWPYMSTAGIDASVTAYLDKGGDIGIVGAMLPNMSRVAARTIAQKYYKEKSNDDYDWIFKPYL